MKAALEAAFVMLRDSKPSDVGRKVDCIPVAEARHAGAEFTIFAWKDEERPDLPVRTFRHLPGAVYVQESLLTCTEMVVTIPGYGGWDGWIARAGMDSRLK